MAVSSLEYSSQFDHTPFYCEENVYFLCKKLCANGVADADRSDLYVVFISNEKKQAYKSVFHLSQKTDLLGIRFFRIVHAPIFLRFFAFDRRHMKDPAGNWIAEPPSYEPIVAEDNNVHNLNEYIEIRTKDISTNVGAKLINGVSNKKLGVAMNENQLEEFFSKSLNEF
ncbi:hypothetical protein EZV62_005301 [Acer yangbiense]|uniref:Protein N-terminal glutamine amidohydrolase n=1 Tax=Acer yangbiense TaxID=1000413 RepID=A0A5C7IPG4_9ROSI|nr:hypothetical protein EZV62_005301 [Acer yangbiense]